MSIFYYIPAVILIYIIIRNIWKLWNHGSDATWDWNYGFSFSVDIISIIAIVILLIGGIIQLNQLRMSDRVGGTFVYNFDNRHVVKLEDHGDCSELQSLYSLVLEDDTIIGGRMLNDVDGCFLAVVHPDRKATSMYRIYSGTFIKKAFKPYIYKKLE